MGRRVGADVFGEIVSAVFSGESYRRVAERFRVSPATVGRIVNDERVLKRSEGERAARRCREG